VNARDSIVGPGRITLQTRNVVLDAATRVGVDDRAPGEHVLLTVEDSGCGMDADTLAKVFEPFFTTKTLGKGTGLGLATVYGIAKQNAGFIDVRSELGRGTAFSIYLPRARNEAEASIEAVAPQPRLPGNETILVAEDEPEMLGVITQTLEALGYAVLSATAPQAALQLAQEHVGTIHLLLTDVVMPEMNGRTLATKVLSLRPNMKCLFTSGFTSDIIANRGVLEEGVCFIQKPFSRDALAAKVREALGSGPGRPT